MQEVGRGCLDVTHVAVLGVQRPCTSLQLVCGSNVPGRGENVGDAEGRQSILIPDDVIPAPVSSFQQECPAAGLGEPPRRSLSNPAPKGM